MERKKNNVKNTSIKSNIHHVFKENMYGIISKSYFQLFFTDSEKNMSLGVCVSLVSFSKCFAYNQNSV